MDQLLIDLIMEEPGNADAWRAYAERKATTADLLFTDRLQDESDNPPETRSEALQTMSLGVLLAIYAELRAQRVDNELLEAIRALARNIAEPR